MRLRPDELKRLRPYCYGDFYPLLSFSLEQDTWAAWQLDRPDLGEGVVQVFRREGSPYDSAHLCLHGLDAEATYVVTDLDTEQTHSTTGCELMQQGLCVDIPGRPAALLFKYQKQS